MRDVGPPPGQRRIRLWFGSHVVADYAADAETAKRYAAAMEQRFAGLHITNDPLLADGSLTTSGCVAPVPAEQLWGLTP